MKLDEIDDRIYHRVDGDQLPQREGGGASKNRALNSPLYS